nr:hypothetical protein BaRGS_011839 [Batillaria attramentaria]
MNPEDIYNSIKKTSADIQNLSLGTKLDGYDDIKKKREFASQDSGIQELRNDSPDAVDGRRGHQHTYNPHQYQDDANALNGFNKSGRDNGEASYDKGVTIPDILRELSNHNERVRERRKMLDSLLKMVRNNAISKEQWDEHFKSILLILIETFGDSDIGGLSDLNSDEQVQRAAEECALVIPTAINPEQALPILNSIIQTAKFPIHWAAIKMQVEGYDDSDSRVRKAAVFCLVNIYMQVGEALRPYLSDLNSSKTKLLNLYIKRAQEDSKSGIMSPIASDT